MDEYCESVVQTYSNIQLFNAKKYIEPSSNNKTIVYRYITPEDKAAIFNEREAQIISLVTEGEIAEEDKNVVDGFRNYSWALMLLKTHPENKL